MGFLNIFACDSLPLTSSKAAVLNDNGLRKVKKDMEVLQKAGETIPQDEKKQLEVIVDKWAAEKPLTDAEYKLFRKVAGKATENLDLKLVNYWWETQGKPNADKDREQVVAAGLHGGKEALTWTAAVPAAMAVGYLLLIFYFRLTGGYKALHVTDEPKLP